MLNIKPPNYKYCPYCATKLKIKVEEDKKRKYCPKDNWTYYPHAFNAVHAVIIKNGKVLLVKRNREPNKGKWQLPAGFVEFGESLLEALKREVKEEVGLTLKDARLAYVDQAKDDPRALGQFRFYYEVKAVGKIKAIDVEENAEIKWFSIDKLPKMAWPQHGEVAKKVQNGKI